MAFCAQDNRTETVILHVLLKDGLYQFFSDSYNVQPMYIRW